MACCNRLEVEVDDDVIKEFAVPKALQVFGCHGDAAFRGWRGVLN